MEKSVVTYREIGRNGRLCNQYFQIAGTIAYALDCNKEYVFPPWAYGKWMQKELPIGEAPNAINSIVQFHYAPIEALPGRNVNLVNGHMQSSKYFAHHWDEIKPYLTIKDEHKKYIWKKYGSILQNRSCAIHIRRTDYGTPVNMNYHGVMPLRYYISGIRHLFPIDSIDPNKLLDELEKQNIHFVVCSDDIAWCKENLKLPNIHYIEGEEDVIDLFLMSYCRDFIISLNPSVTLPDNFCDSATEAAVACTRSDGFTMRQ